MGAIWVLVVADASSYFPFCFPMFSKTLGKGGLVQCQRTSHVSSLTPPNKLPPATRDPWAGLTGASCPNSREPSTGVHWRPTGVCCCSAGPATHVPWGGTLANHARPSPASAPVLLPTHPATTAVRSGCLSLPSFATTRAPVALGFPPPLPCLSLLLCAHHF